MTKVKKLSKVRLQQLWVMILLLSYCSQSFAFTPISAAPQEQTKFLQIEPIQGTNLDTPPSDIMVGCHSLKSIDLKTQLAATDQRKSMICCDGDCSMADCHPPLALLNSIHLSLSLFHPASPNTHVSSTLTPNTNSLFRPPIIA